MVDFDLTRKFLNKIQKDVVELEQTIDLFNDKQEQLIKRIIGELDLMYDVLHLDELTVINPNRGNDTTKH